MCIQYQNMTDEEVVKLSVNDEEAMTYLMNKYKNFVLSKSRPYFLIGGDNDDLIQEGMIGLYKAAVDYDSDRQVKFKTFADLCITRQIITAVKASTRQKHMPLNTYLSLDKYLYDNETDMTVGQMMANHSYGEPEQSIIRDENITQLKKAMESVLSDMERKVLAQYLSGKSYKEISVALGREIKSIDNALQRVKKKLDEFFLKQDSK